MSNRPYFLERYYPPLPTSVATGPVRADLQEPRKLSEHAPRELKKLRTNVLRAQAAVQAHWDSTLGGWDGDAYRKALAKLSTAWRAYVLASRPYRKLKEI